MTDTATIAETLPADVVKVLTDLAAVHDKLAWRDGSGARVNIRDAVALIRSQSATITRLTASLAAEREAREMAERERDEACEKLAVTEYKLQQAVNTVQPMIIRRAEAAEAEIARREQAVADDEVEAACKGYWPAHWPQHFAEADAASIRGHMRNAIAAAFRAREEATDAR